MLCGSDSFGPRHNEIKISQPGFARFTAFLVLLCPQLPGGAACDVSLDCGFRLSGCVTLYPPFVKKMQLYLSKKEDDLKCLIVREIVNIHIFSTNSVKLKRQLKMHSATLTVRVWNPLQ